jgi:hypothetical protein
MRNKKMKGGTIMAKAYGRAECGELYVNGKLIRCCPYCDKPQETLEVALV